MSKTGFIAPAGDQTVENPPSGYAPQVIFCPVAATGRTARDPSLTLADDGMLKN